MTAPVADLVHEFEGELTANGRSYRTQVFAEPRENIWVAWIEFTGDDGGVLRTAEETTQPNREAVAYWAGGLERVYLEGALARAR